MFTYLLRKCKLYDKIYIEKQSEKKELTNPITFEMVDLELKQHKNERIHKTHSGLCGKSICSNVCIRFKHTIGI